MNTTLLISRLQQFPLLRFFGGVTCIAFWGFLPAICLSQNRTVLWSEDWERTNWTDDWHVDAGTWEVGKPTNGPGKAYRGENCAATVLGSNYSEPVDSRLIRHTSFVVPPASQNPRLRFWHWYSFHNGDNGVVQIKVGSGNWQTISDSYTYSSSGVWTYPSLDLRAYAGMTVQIAFYFHSQCLDCFRGDVATGWYIDDVALITGPITFNNPEGWESGIGDWYVDRGTWEIGTPTLGAHTGQKCASTISAGNYSEPVATRLTSPKFVVARASANPSLGFWHRYNFHNGDSGFVQIRIRNGSWITILGPYTGTSSGTWTPPFKELSSYADSTVQLAFYFKSQCVDCFRGDVSDGWDIDDIQINPVQPCTYSIFPASQSFPPSGGTGTVSVTATSGCSWTAISSDNWIKITSGNSGSGNGTVNYSIDPNTGTNSRSGTITVTGQNFTGTHTVTQGVNGSPITIIAPNGGEIWAVDSVQTIRWSSSNLVGNVKIEFSNNAGLTWSIIASNTPNVGSFLWTPTNPISDRCRAGIASDRCLIRISSVANNSIFDQSDALFSVLRKCDVNFDGVVNEIDLQLIIDIILERIKPTPSQFWAADCNDNNRVDVADYQRAVNKFFECAKIKIISPNGGEIWRVGDVQTISWDKSIISNNVRIELSTNAGNSWSTIDSSAVNTGSYSWTPTEIHASNNCLMRITAAASNISDTSDAVFAITKGVVTFRGLFNTGVDGNGVVLPVGSKEMHYSLTGPLSPAIVISPLTSPPQDAWVTPPAGSAWIGPTESNVTDPPGLYVYTLKVELTGFDPSTAFITGDAAADNTLSIFLNGVDTGLTFPDQYHALKSFTIDKGFISGMNTLEFKVTNLPPSGLNPTGLLVANLKGQAKPLVTPIFPTAPSPQLANQEFWVDVKVGDNANPVANLFGASFCLTFTHTDFIDVVTPYLSTVIPGDFLGNDLVYQSNIDETAGKVCIGISRKTGQSGMNGSGTLARIKFIARSNTPNQTQVQFCVADVIANDPSGNSISLTPSCVTVTIQQCVTVWSGDTNNDGRVNQVDVLPIGLYWGRTGPACQTPPSCAWNARCCSPWSALAATYADANGDGKVDQADVLCIGLNWNKTHSANFSSSSNGQFEKIGSVMSASLAPDVKPVQAPSQEFFCESRPLK